MTTFLATPPNYPSGKAVLDASGIDDTTETIVLSADPGSAMSTANFVVVIDHEHVLVASRSGATLTCTDGRGYAGTTAAAHAAGAPVTEELCSEHVSEIKTAVNARLEDAPNDGNVYGRKNQGWEEIVVAPTSTYFGIDATGLLARYPFRNTPTSLTTIVDVINGHDMTVGAGTVERAEGAYGDGLSFTTVSTYCSNSTSGIPDACRQSNFSWAAWMKPPATFSINGGICPILGLDGSSNYVIFQMLPPSNGSSLWRCVTVGGGVGGGINGPTIAANSDYWHHIAITRDYVSPTNSTFKLYVDGTEYSRVFTDVDDVVGADTSIRIGTPTAGWSTNCVWSDITYWSRTLGASEVLTLALSRNAC